MEKIALWPSYSQKVENSTKETCIMPTRGMCHLNISSDYSVISLTFSIHSISNKRGEKKEKRKKETKITVNWKEGGVGRKVGGQASEPPGHSPRISRSLRASTPGDRMKNTGVAGLVSSNALTKSSLVLSTYLAPSFSSTKFLWKRIMRKEWSGLLTLKTVTQLGPA